MAIICAQCGHRNPDGSRFCVNGACGAYLAWADEAGGSHGPPPPPEPRAPSPRPADPTLSGYGRGSGQGDVAASMALTDSALAVQPGETASTTVSVHNGGGQVEQFAITVLGPSAGWVEIEPAVLAVYPDARGEAVIRWSPPRLQTTIAGQAPFTVRADSILHPGLQVHATGVLDVGEFRELTASLTPQTTSGRWQTTHRIELTNAGNIVETVQLKATDPAGRIRFTLPDGDLPIPPGSRSVDMPVRPPWRFFGRPVSQPFQVLATPQPPLPPVRLDGTRAIVPLIAGWIPKVAAGLVLLGVAAAMTLYATSSKGDPSTGGASPGPNSPPPVAAASAPPGGSSEAVLPPGASDSALPSATSVVLGSTPWAVVDAAGTVALANGVTTAAVRGPGKVEITFAGDVSKCVYLATVAVSGGQPVPDDGLVFTSSGSNANSVVVETRNINGTPAPHPFHLQLRCKVGDTVVVDGGRDERGTDNPRVNQTEDGQWEIRFSRDVSKCAFVATIGDPGAGNPPTGIITVGTGRDNSRAVFVETRGRDDIRTDMPFHLQTRCSGSYVVIGADGEFARGEEVARTVRPGIAGTWEIDFEKDVARCSYVASIGAADGAPIDTFGEVFVASGPRPTSVQVQTRKLDPETGQGQLKDYPFHLHVVC